MLIGKNLIGGRFMFKSANPYDTQRLTDENIQKYILTSHLNYEDVSLKSVNKIALYPLTFGNNEKNSIILNIALCVFHYCFDSFDKNVILNAVKSLMTHLFYDPDKETFLFLFIKPVYKRILKYFQFSKKIKTKFFKGIGFNFNTIKEQINRKTPIILYLTSDGRNYYKNCALTVIGYAQFTMLNNVWYPVVKQDKVKNMLIVYDGFSEKISYVDYDAISVFSCITY